MSTGKRNALRRKLLTAAVAACFAGEVAYANPVGPNVVRGQVSFATQGSTLSVTNTPGAIINWQQFSIQANEATRFIQQSASSAVLNRVVGIDPSRILGTLQSNGRVFLINPNGILFGAGARIDVGGLVASTLKLSNEDFIAGRMHFVGDVGTAGAVINQGSITAAQGGRVYLIGQAVENQGVINAPNGDIVLAAGHSVRVTEGASPGVQVEIVAPADRTVNVSELVYSPRGIYAGLVRNSGAIQANSVVRGADGSITLKASQELALEPGRKVAANGLDGGRVVMEAPQAVLAGRVEALGSAGAIELVAREVTVQGEVHSAGELRLSTEDLTIVDGSLRTNSGAMAIGGNFVQTGGDMAPGSSTIAVGGNWRREGGSFDAGTSTVEFTDASKVSTISGDNTFYNFTSVTPSKHLIFEAGATQTVLGDFTLRGEKFHLVDLRSTNPGGEQWKLDARGNVDVKFVHLGDAWNIGPTPIKALPSNSHGNNTGWDTDPIWVAVGPGNWSTDANWDTGVRPGVADTVTFNATSTQNSTVDAGFAGTIANLNINAGYTGTIDLARSLTVNSAYSQAAGTFTAGGNVLVIGDTYTLSAGTFNAPSSTLNFNATGAARTFTISGGTFNHNNGTVQFGNGSNFGIAIDVPANQPFNNVTVANAGNQTLSVANGKTLTVDGTLTLTNGLFGNGTGTIDPNGAIVVGAGFDGAASPQGTLLLIDGAGDQSFVVPSGAILPRTTLNSAATTLSFAPGASASLGGDFTLQAGTFMAPSGTLTITNSNNFQNFTVSGGTFNHNNGTVQFGNNSFGITVDVPAIQHFNNVTVNLANSHALTVPNGNILSVDGTLTLTNGLFGSTTGIVDANGAIVVGASFDGGTAPQGMQLLIDGAGDQSFVVPSGASLPRVTLNSTNTTISFAPGSSASLGADFTLQAGTFIAPSGTLTIANGSNFQNFTVSGGTFNHNNGTVQFGNNSFGITVDVPAIQHFNNVTVALANNHALTVPNGNTLSVDGTLTLTNGLFGSTTGIIDANGTIAIGATFDGATAPQGMPLLIDGAGNQSFVVASGAVLPRTLLNSANTTISFAPGASAGLSGDLTLQAGTFIAPSGTLTLANNSNPQNFTVNGGTFNHNNGTVQFGNNTNFEITADVPANQPFNNVTVAMLNGAGRPLIITAGKSLTVLGTLTHTNGAISTGSLLAQGNVTINAGADGGSSPLQFTGGNPQTYTDNGGAKTTGTVTVDKTPGSTVTLATDMSYNAAGQDLAINSGTLDLAGRNLTVNDVFSINAAGNLQLQGAETINKVPVIAAGATVTYNGTAPVFTLKNFPYSNLVINGGATTVFSFPANLTTLDTLTLNNSITSLGGFTLTAATLNNNATLRLQGNEVVTITNMDTNSGLMQYVGDGAGGLNSFTIKDFGGTDYFDLAIAGVSGSETFTVASPLKLNGTLAHTTGTLNLGANVTTAAGAITSNDVVSLSANVLVDTTDAGALAGGATMSFAGTINADAASNNRTLALTGGTAGNVTLNGTVGGVQPLQALTITSANTASLPTVTTRNGGIDVTATAISLNGNLSTDSIATAGAVNLAGAVSLGAPVTIDTDAATTDANLSFNSNVNEAQALSLNSGAGSITMPANIGNATPLSSLTIDTAGALNFNGTTSVTGALNVTSGALTQGGALNIGGDSAFAAGANAITLTNAGNDFVGIVTLSNSGANAVSIRDTNALILAGGTFGGPLSAQSNGNLTQTGAIVANSTSSFNAGAGAITLTNAGNDFSGAVSLSNSGANNVAITDSNALLLGASTVGGTLTVAAGAGGAGALTQSGVLSASALTASAAGGIDLASSANDIATVSLTNTVSGDVAYLSNRLGGVTLTGSNAVGAWSATEQGAGGLTVGAAGINTNAGDVVLTAPAGPMTVSGAITSVSGNLTLTAGANVIVDDNVTTTGNVQFASGAAIDINPVAPITVSGNDVTLTAVDLNLGNPAALGSLSLTATDSLTLTASNALNVRGGAVGGAFVRVEGTGITINADTVVFAGGAGADAHGAAVANAGDVTLTGTSSITFSAGAGANADGVLSAPTWNVTITTPSCVGCNVLSVNPFTNPPSEFGIHALSVTGLPPVAPPIIVVPVDPAPPLVIDDSAVVAAQLTASQRAEKTDASEASSSQLCIDQSVAGTSDSQGRLSTQSACKPPNRLIMPAEKERLGNGLK